MIWGDKMIINFMQEPMGKLLALSKASGSDEIGGILIGYLKNDQIIVTDITVPKQKVTAASIFFDDESINEQLSELFFSESEVGFVGWWHTHGTGKTFWSSTDQKDGIDKFLQPLIDNVEGDLESKWLVSVVANASGDLLGRLDYYTVTPFGNYIETINEVPVVCLPIITQEQIEEAKLIIKDNVSTYKYVYNGKQFKGNRYYNWDYEDYRIIEAQNDEPTITEIKFNKKEEELINQAVITHQIDKESIEDLVNIGYDVSEAIDILIEGCVWVK